MIENLIEYNDGELIDEVYFLIEKFVVKKHNIKLEDLVENDPEDKEVLIYKEQYQDEINTLFDIIEAEFLNYIIMKEVGLKDKTELPIPKKLYLHKEYATEDNNVINCRSIYTKRQSETDIEYIISKNK